MVATKIYNIGKLVSGDLDRPLLDYDAIVIKNGVIADIGKNEDLDSMNYDLEIDANGMTVTPGFIDPHLHGCLGDWNQISRCIGWMEGMLLAGTTTLMSQGDNSVAGIRPNDAAAAKALAILGKRTFDNYKPGGSLKVHGGGIMVVEGLTRHDFQEMYDAGCRVVAEIGGWGAYKYESIKEMLEWARELDMLITMHFAPTAIPGSGPLGPDEAKLIKPDVAVHVNMTGNGGGYNLGVDGIRKLIEETECYIEFAMVSGNYKMSVEMVNILKERNELDRLVTGSDSPIGTGLLPSAMLRIATFISCMNDIPAQEAIAFVTGNNAKVYRLNTGIIEVGREADILIIDAPLGSQYDALKAMELGDLCGTAMIMVDGKIVALRGRDTRPISHGIIIDGVEYKPWNSPDEYLFGPFEYSFGKIVQY